MPLKGLCSRQGAFISVRQSSLGSGCFPSIQHLEIRMLLVIAAC